MLVSQGWIFGYFWWSLRPTRDFFSFFSCEHRATDILQWRFVCLFALFLWTTIVLSRLHDQLVDIHRTPEKQKEIILIILLCNSNDNTNAFLFIYFPRVTTQEPHVSLFQNACLTCSAGSRGIDFHLDLSWTPAEPPKGLYISFWNLFLLIYGMPLWPAPYIATTIRPNLKLWFVRKA